jgi:hypothetical protein
VEGEEKRKRAKITIENSIFAQIHEDKWSKMDVT